MNSISIITICFNNLQELINTCRSVDIQSELPFEHLIIDGSTQPHIKNWLEQHSQPGYRRWINERDNGIADAFNKGVQHAKGDILVLLNSGDSYFDADSLEKVVKAFQDHPEIQWLHAKYQLVRGGQQVVIGKPFDPNKIYRGMRSICHQTMYVRKELYDKYGLFDTGLRISMDYDFLIRIKDSPFYFLPDPIVSFAPEGISSVNYQASLKEGSMVYRKYFGNTFLHQAWQARLKMLFYLLNSPIGKWLYKTKVWMGWENM